MPALLGDSRWPCVMLWAALFFLAAQAHAEEAGWTYDQPKKWSEAYKDCAGSAQSPIDIVTEELAAGGAGEEPLRCDYQQAFSTGDVQVANDGHAIHVNGAFGTLSLPDGPYKVLQVRLHFPSEHTVDGKAAAGELQVLHVRQGRGAAGAISIAMVAMLLQLPEDTGGRNSTAAEREFFSSLGFPHHLPAMHHSQGSMGHVNLGAFQRQFSGSYFHYQGSLTMPPCSEEVHWYMLEEPAVVTRSMVSAFKKIFPNPQNNRPTQPLNGREVLRSQVALPSEFPKTEEAEPWTYQNTGAWRDRFPGCGGTGQSPINIDPYHCIVGKDHHSLEFHYQSLDQRTLANSGSTLQVTGGFGTLRLPDGLYDVERFEFRFPSEHAVAKTLAAGEMQIVHRRRGCHGAGCLAIVGMLLLLPNEGREYTGPQRAFFESLGLSRSAILPNKSQALPVNQSLDLNTFHDQLAGDYFHYVGSLTEPPCTEAVHWYVLEGTAVVSADIVDSFKKLFPNPQNHRPTQPLHGRKVIRSVEALPGEFNMSRLTEAPTTSAAATLPTTSAATALPTTTAAATTTAHSSALRADDGFGSCTDGQEESWPLAKKAWCCKHKQRGCPKSPPEEESQLWTWTYDHPEQWAEGYTACGGQSQSPINIPAANLPVAGDPQALQVDYYAYEASGERKIVNDGHAVQVDGDFGTLLLPDGLYQVKHFVFHFPSEHRIDGRLAAGEMQIVHQKQGSHGTDDLAIIGLLLESELSGKRPITREEKDFFSNLGFGQPGQLPGQNQERGSKGGVDLNTFRKQLQGEYYHYKGSLTTPPCSETVHWYVLKEQATVTFNMIASFKELFRDPANNRPTHMLHSRKVVRSHLALPGEFKSCNVSMPVVPLRTTTLPMTTTRCPLLQCPFNCHSPGADAEKAEWCCSHEGLLCTTARSTTTTTTTRTWTKRTITTTSTSSVVHFDCDAAYNNWKAAWSMKKKRYCCEHTGRGCHQHDCSAGYANWMEQWSVEKKEWCCRHMRRGCSPEPDKFDCDAGFSNWVAGWSARKKAWCCRHKHRGCPGHQDPETWPDAYPSCGGSIQSPINIIPSRCARGTKTQPLMWDYHALPRRYLINNGHALQVNGNFGSLLLPDGRYVVQHFEFRTSSEHAVDGKLTAGEMQIFHAAPGSKPGSQVLAIVALRLLKAEGNQPDARQAAFFRNLGLVADRKMPRPSEKMAIEHEVDLGVFQRLLSGKYYHYAGSLTVPPCQEEVRWYVVEEPVVVDHGVVDALKEALGGRTNNRPTQPLHGREVIISNPALPGEFFIPSHGHWGYQQPALWAREFPRCAGHSQSPIDIVLASSISGPGGFQRLRVAYHPLDNRWIVNTGHALQVDGAFGTLKLPDGVYEAKQIRFHFPSEHKVNGKLAVGELQIVHKRRGARGGADGLAVVGLLLQLPMADRDGHGERLHQAFFRNLGFGKGQRLPGRTAELKCKDPVNLKAFHEELNGHYYHYKGSLTVPPCSETVHWYILQDHATVTADMIDSFKVLFPDPQNNRPTQPLGSRQVIRSRVALPGEFGGGGSPPSSSTPNIFDCDAGYNNWEKGWSLSKKAWCCRHVHRGCPEGTGGGGDWDYRTPGAWRITYPRCGGRAQSPIDLVPTLHADDGGPQQLTMKYVALPQCSIKNSDRTLHVEGRFGRFALPDGIYEAEQIRLRFPSEHTARGKLFAGELQILHRRHGSLGPAGLAIVSVLLQLPQDLGHERDGDRTLQRAFFRNLGLGRGGKLPSEGQTVSLHGPVDLNAFHEELQGRYSHYLGSLTTPPCSEGVHWYVLTGKAVVDVDMVASFKELFPDPANNRPVQPLNGRRVVNSRVTAAGTCEYRMDSGDCVPDKKGLGGWLWHMMGQKYGLVARGRLAGLVGPASHLWVLLVAAMVASAAAALVGLRSTCRCRRYQALLSHDGVWGARARRVHCQAAVPLASTESVA